MHRIARTTFKWPLILALVLLVLPLTGFAAKPPVQNNNPVIESVYVDLDLEILTIEGQYLMLFNCQRVVLGLNGDLPILYGSDTLIDVDITGVPLGDYRLEVFTGDGCNKFDIFDVTNRSNRSRRRDRPARTDRPDGRNRPNRPNRPNRSRRFRSHRASWSYRRSRSNRSRWC
jgi:hypothetical protein